MNCALLLVLFPIVVALFATIAYRALRFVASLSRGDAR